MMFFDLFQNRGIFKIFLRQILVIDDVKDKSLLGNCLRTFALAGMLQWGHFKLITRIANEDISLSI